MSEDGPFDAVINLAARAGVRQSLESPEIYGYKRQGRVKHGGVLPQTRSEEIHSSVEFERLWRQ